MCLVRTVSAIEVLRGIQIADHSEENWRRCHHQCAGVHWHTGLLAMDHMGMGLKDAGRGRGVVNNVGQCCYNCYTNKQITLH